MWYLILFPIQWLDYIMYRLVETYTKSPILEQSEGIYFTVYATRELPYCWLGRIDPFTFAEYLNMFEEGDI
jgi:hypothetical protein